MTSSRRATSAASSCSATGTSAGEAAACAIARPARLWRKPCDHTPFPPHPRCAALAPVQARASMARCGAPAPSPPCATRKRPPSPHPASNPSPPILPRASSKSTIAAEAAQKLNPGIHINALQVGRGRSPAQRSRAQPSSHAAPAMQRAASCQRLQRSVLSLKGHRGEGPLSGLSLAPHCSGPRRALPLPHAAAPPWGHVAACPCPPPCPFPPRPAPPPSEPRVPRDRGRVQRCLLGGPGLRGQRPGQRQRAPLRRQPVGALAWCP
jgi:hypothetical protein